VGVGEPSVVAKEEELVDPIAHIEVDLQPSGQAR
jgi:hypothetical protein